MSEDAKRNLRNVMVLTLMDKELTKGERTFIEKLREKLAISAEDFRELVEQVRKDPKKIALPSDPREAEQAIELLVGAAMADGEVSPGERKLLQRIAAHVQMTDSQLEAMLSGPIEPGDEDQINALVDEVYASFATWDEKTQATKLAELGGSGRAAVIALLRILESYRAPDGAPDALALKRLVAEQLGTLGDDRAVYYLVQQINIGDSDDEITNSQLRFAAVEALGKIVGKDFTPDRAGIEAGRNWWAAPDSKKYDRLGL